MTAGDEHLVSIIIPSFNRARLLERAIDSALGQTYPRIEIVVVDDGSTDDTVWRLERIRSPKLKALFSHWSVGPARARNLGIARSSGAYVTFLDADSTWEPWKVEAQLARFHEGLPALGAVYCGRRVHLADGGEVEIRPRDRGDVFAALLRRNRVPLSTLMVKRSAMLDVGTFDADLPACDDWDFVLRLARRYDFDYVGDPAVHQHGGIGWPPAGARSTFIANHRIFRRFGGRPTGRAELAAYLALQSRELLELGRSGMAARYALRSLRFALGGEEKLALRTLRRIMARRRLGRMLVQAYAWRNAATRAAPAARR